MKDVPFRSRFPRAPKSRKFESCRSVESRKQIESLNAFQTVIQGLIRTVNVHKDRVIMEYWSGCAFNNCYLTPLDNIALFFRENAQMLRIYFLFPQGTTAFLSEFFEDYDYSIERIDVITLSSHVQYQ